MWVLRDLTKDVDFNPLTPLDKADRESDLKYRFPNQQQSLNLNKNLLISLFLPHNSSRSRQP